MSEETVEKRFVTVWVDNEGRSDLDTNMSRPEEINWWLDVGKSIIFQKSFTVE